MKNIFLVTVLCVEKTERLRTWGWFPTLQEAKSAVLTNATDMFEHGYYKFAVIEEMSKGILPIAKQELWFYADYSKENVKKYSKPNVYEVTKPESISNVINFGIG